MDEKDESSLQQTNKKSTPADNAKLSKGADAIKCIFQKGAKFKAASRWVFQFPLYDTYTHFQGEVTLYVHTANRSKLRLCKISFLI